MQSTQYSIGQLMATREAFGRALVNLGKTNPDLVVLDAEMSNSTFTNLFQAKFPDRFFEMFIAEQNMLSTALGLSLAGKVPFVATFAAFLTRAYDQIRMAQYTNPKTNIKIMGSHCGVSIGEDGPSQMALEDIAFFRTILNGVVLYPSDAVSTEAVVKIMLEYHGISYLRATREKLPVLYNSLTKFKIGGSRTIFQSDNDQITVIGAGITLHEAIKAYKILQTQNVNIRVIDLYSIKPLDLETLTKAGIETQAIIVVEDHFQEGGIYEAVCSSNIIKVPIHSLAVTKTPRSGTPAELLAFEKIDVVAIVNKTKQILGK